MGEPGSVPDLHLLSQLPTADSLKGEYAHLGSRIALQAMMRTKYLRGCYFAGWCNTAAIFPWAKGKYSIIS